MRKAFVCFTVALLFIATGLFADGKYNGYVAPKMPVPAGHLVFYVGLDPDSEKNLTAEFTDQFSSLNPGVTVELINAPGNEKLLAMIAAGNPPDVWWTGSAADINVANGTLMDISGLLKGDPYLNDVLPQYLEPYKGMGGGIFGLPNGTWFWGLYYNKKLFDQAKVPYPTDNWTWDDLLSAAQKLTKADSAGKTTQWGYENSGITWGGGLYPFILSNGGRDISADGSRYLLDSPESLGAIKFFYDLIFKYKVTPTPTDITALGSTDRQMFANGKTAMTTDALHPDVFPIFADGLGWGNFDVVVLPHPKGKSLVNWAGFGGFSVSSKTTNPRAAVELVKFLGAGSKIWWPDPTLKSGIAAFISASNEKYPNLKNTHFGAAFNLGATKVQFAYTSNPFGVGRYADADWAAFRDKLWVGNAKPDDLKTLVPQWNAKFAPGLERDLKQVPLLAAYGEALQKLLKQVKAQ